MAACEALWLPFYPESSGLETEEAEEEWKFQMNSFALSTIIKNRKEDENAI